MCKKESYVVSAVMVLAVVVVMFFPLTGTAGNLEPSAAPAPTMKTLDQIPPTWSQKLPAAQRFELVLDGAGVLDKETGLVWEQSPSTTTQYWSNAIYACDSKNVGGRLGWHLPTVEQLASLVDTSVVGTPKLPAGHPFTGVQSSVYWSATTVAYGTTNAWVVGFYGGDVGYDDKTIGNYVWCVRGGQTDDGQ